MLGGLAQVDSQVFTQEELNKSADASAELQLHRCLKHVANWLQLKPPPCQNQTNLGGFVRPNVEMLSDY